MQTSWLIGVLLTLSACSEKDKSDEPAEVPATEPGSEGLPPWMRIDGDGDGDGDGVIDSEELFPMTPMKALILMKMGSGQTLTVMMRTIH